MAFASHSVAELARRLARDAEGVCRHYLSNGRREGSYWLVGDVANSPGRSLFVRLHGPDTGKGAAGKWTDAATGEHGDLLDLIGKHCGHAGLREAADEASRFLNMPSSSRAAPDVARRQADGDKSDAARRLFALSQPVSGTLACTYLRARGIESGCENRALRFHPSCYYRDTGGKRRAFPALIAAITDGEGAITGVHRTWLDPGGDGKARVDTPRRAMGSLLGHGVRLGFDKGVEVEIMVAGEGIETMLSLREILPAMPMIAALSAGHLGAVLFPQGLKLLYIAADGDGAGRHGTERLSQRAREAGIEVLALRPTLGDFNDDLRRLGRAPLERHIRRQLIPGDAARFILEP